MNANRKSNFTLNTLAESPIGMMHRELELDYLRIRITKKCFGLPRPLEHFICNSFAWLHFVLLVAEAEPPTGFRAKEPLALALLTDSGAR